MHLAQLDIRNAFTPAKKLGGDTATFASLLDQIIPLLTIIGSLLFLAMGLYGAFIYITAGGDAEKTKKSQSIFRYAVIGFLIILLAYTMLTIVGKIFNISTLIPF